MILVTGGTGFLGSTLIKQLINDGKAVTALKRESSVIPESLRSSSLIQWVDADITDYFALSDIFAGISQVFHCAAKVSYHKDSLSEMLQTNIEGTKNVVNLCLEYAVRLVHVSSIAALGSNRLGIPVTEADKWEHNPKISKYSLSKYKSELEVWRGIMEGLDAVIVNPSLIMGLGTGKKGSGVIFEMVNKGLPVYPSGSVGIVDVEDVANIMRRLMDTSHITAERYVLNSENITHKELLTSIASYLGKKAPTIEAKPYLLGVGWRIAKLISLFNGKHPALTAESARTSSAKLAYNSAKIQQTLDYSFKPIQQLLGEIAEKEYHNSN